MKIKERFETVNFFDGLEDISLLHLSDLHLWLSKKLTDELQKRILKVNPDLIVLTGDYFDTLRGAKIFHNFLSEVSLKYTVLFIRGNHDFVFGKKIADSFRGIPNCFCVEDSIYSYTSRSAKIYNFTSWELSDKLTKQPGQRNIVLIHDPEKLKENEFKNIGLILAGHLHGAQFRFFKAKNNSYFPGNILYKYCMDRKQVAETTIIISRGLGDTLPIRINCPKEIVRISIK